jgi:hypothetical protein
VAFLAALGGVLTVHQQVHRRARQKDHVWNGVDEVILVIPPQQEHRTREQQAERVPRATAKKFPTHDLLHQ